MSGIFHFCLERTDLIGYMARNRALAMPALNWDANVIPNCGLGVEMTVLKGFEVKSIHIKSLSYIFQQSQGAGMVPPHQYLYPAICNISNIDYAMQYHGKLLLIRWVASHCCNYGRQTMSFDAEHCWAAGPQSYGTSFEVVIYDSSSHVVPITVSHAVALNAKRLREKSSGHCGIFRKLFDWTGDYR